ncbi:DNA/RNA non-specific endonuclease [Methylobacterium sp.]|jgi:endonuclease G|uniref:DNA/RNA non-specific endonuclease n=1 Tax=Methylobacterium sp. TaxID=409 RepID=UPI0025DAF937|nr:DNA/RNA non-specific endonuclease [Methylobacterium sp.]MBY0257578.1 DNA/RNA non-specific endonuclease [Methylobacterium sp.]
MARTPILLLSACLLAAPAGARGQDCADAFADGRRPDIVNPKLTERAVPLCYDAFALLHSGVSRTPLYAAEHLTRASVAAARRVDRVDAFHDEDALPAADRARLEDYIHSGYDRGHMAPAGDMPTGAAQAQSFSLANIVPQDRALNRGLWAAIEESVRRLATRRGRLYVVTGPIYSGDAVQSINGRVLVPTYLFKALYDPETGEAGAYLVANRDDPPWRAVSLDALREASGLDVFPTLAPTVKARAMDLPEPRTYSRGEPEGDAHARRRAPEPDSFEAWAKAELHRALRQLWRAVMRAIF